LPTTASFTGDRDSGVPDLAAEPARAAMDPPVDDEAGTQRLAGVQGHERLAPTPKPEPQVAQRLDTRMHVDVRRQPQARRHDSTERCAVQSRREVDLDDRPLVRVDHAGNRDPHTQRPRSRRPDHGRQTVGDQRQHGSAVPRRRTERSRRLRQHPAVRTDQRGLDAARQQVRCGDGRRIRREPQRSRGLAAGGRAGHGVLFGQQTRVQQGLDDRLDRSTRYSEHARESGP
jgi:hypothetical protein